MNSRNRTLEFTSSYRKLRGFNAEDISEYRYIKDLEHLLYLLGLEKVLADTEIIVRYHLDKEGHLILTRESKKSRNSVTFIITEDTVALPYSLDFGGNITLPNDIKNAYLKQGIFDKSKFNFEHSSLLYKLLFGFWTSLWLVSTFEKKYRLIPKKNLTYVSNGLKSYIVHNINLSVIQNLTSVLAYRENLKKSIFICDRLYGMEEIILTLVLDSNDMWTCIFKDETKLTIGFGTGICVILTLSDKGYIILHKIFQRVF